MVFSPVGADLLAILAGDFFGNADLKAADLLSDLSDALVLVVTLSELRGDCIDFFVCLLERPKLA